MNKFTILFSDEAEIQLNGLKSNNHKKNILKAIIKTLELMAVNLKHPSLNTHIFKSEKGPNGEKIFESYAQNNTPGAYRIFWHDGPNHRELTIIAITPHP